MKQGVTVRVSHVQDPTGADTPVELPPHTISLQLHTTNTRDWPVRFNLYVTEEGNLRVSCEGGRGQLELINLSGNTVTLRVATE